MKSSASEPSVRLSCIERGGTSAVDLYNPLREKVRVNVKDEGDNG